MTRDGIDFAAVARRLGIPQEAVEVYECPVCRELTAAGLAAPGTNLSIRCRMSSCPHHITGCEWPIIVGETAGRVPNDLLLCPGDLCRFPSGDKDRANYRNGEPVCSRPWARGVVGAGSRLVVWCQERTCVCSRDGFIILANGGRSAYLPAIGIATRRHLAETTSCGRNDARRRQGAKWMPTQSPTVGI